MAMLRPYLLQPRYVHNVPQSWYRLATLCTQSKDVQQADAHLSLLKSANDAKEILDLMPPLDKSKYDRQIYTLPALKALFDLQKQGRSSLRTEQVLSHPRFAELCKGIKQESRSFVMNDITECIKILTFFGAPTNSEIMTVLLQLLRHQINDVSLDHIVFLAFILQKLEKTPLVDALQIALPMLLQIQVSYKLDHENVQQLVDLLGFVSLHRVSDRCIMNVVSSLTLHGTNLSPEQAAETLIALAQFKYFQPQYGKLLQNVFAALENNVDKLPFRSLDYAMKKVVGKNFDQYPMFYNEHFLRDCAQYAINNDIGLMNALYVLKKLNRLSFLHIPLLDYIATLADNLSVVPMSGIITIVAGYSNANYFPANWTAVKAEIAHRSSITHVAIPWIRYNLELLSLDIVNRELLTHFLEPKTMQANMARNTLVDYLQLTELNQTLRLIYRAEYNGPYPESHYLEKATALMLQFDDHPLLKPLEYAFGGPPFVATKVLSAYNHVIDHVLAFDSTGTPVQLPSGQDNALLVEDLVQEFHRVVAVLYLPKSSYAINVNRLRGRFAMYIRTIEALGVPVVLVSPHIWGSLPEPERIPFLQREIQFKLAS